MEEKNRILALYFKISMTVIVALGSALISVSLFTYFGEIENQQKQHNELMQVIVRNQNELAEIKKFILVKFGFDVDNATDQHEWERLMRDTESNPRGIKSKTIIPDLEEILAERYFN